MLWTSGASGGFLASDGMTSSGMMLSAREHNNPSFLALSSQGVSLYLDTWPE